MFVREPLKHDKPVVFDTRLLQSLNEFFKEMKSRLLVYIAENDGVSIEFVQRVSEGVTNSEDDRYEVSRVKRSIAFHTAINCAVTYEGGRVLQTRQFDELINILDVEPGEIKTVEMESSSPREGLHITMSKGEKPFACRLYGDRGIVDAQKSRLRDLLEDSKPDFAVIYSDLSYKAVNFIAAALIFVAYILLLWHNKYIPKDIRIAILPVAGFVGLAWGSGVAGAFKTAFPKGRFDFGSSGRRGKAKVKAIVWIVSTIIFPIFLAVAGI